MKTKSLMFVLFFTILMIGIKDHTAFASVSDSDKIYYLDLGKSTTGNTASTVGTGYFEWISYFRSDKTSYGGVAYSHPINGNSTGYYEYQYIKFKLQKGARLDSMKIGGVNFTEFSEFIQQKPPINVQGQIGDKKVTLTWDYEKPVSGSRFWIWVDGIPKTYATYNLRTLTYPGLTNDRTYTIGLSYWMNDFEGHTDVVNMQLTPTTPRPPTKVVLTADIQSIKVDFDAVPNAVGYYLYYGTNKIRITDNSYTIKDLPENVPVAVQVSTIYAGDSESTKSVAVTAIPLKVPVNEDVDKFVISNLNKSVDSASSILLHWLPIDSIYLKQYKVYQDNVLISTVFQNSLSISGLIEGQTYVFKVTPVDSFDKEFPGATLSYTVPIPDTIPPGIPKDIRVVPDRYTAHVTWGAPSDPDLLGYYIYLDDDRVNASPQLNNSFTLNTLKIDSEYTVSVVSVDTSGNMSRPSNPVRFRTLTLQTVPAAPGNLIVNSFYKGANLSWLPSSSAEEYIVYMDGEQLFKTVQTNAKVNNLSNGQSYSFEVAAINQIGESDKVGPIVVTPSESSPVDVTLGYSLKDISDGTANLFSAQWLLLAFAISIPLSFYISNRVKGLING
ncbi:fibronectin type III domain-containing protein [Paenibacillus sp. NPDC058367]|uniref:fibronectin type III domain-containing protein n=1 Tax=Paenibacillus sp. NPDC058367 TaxID=3346460 RepID=UPI00364B3A32